MRERGRESRSLPSPLGLAQKTNYVTMKRSGRRCSSAVREEESIGEACLWKTRRKNPVVRNEKGASHRSGAGYVLLLRYAGVEETEGSKSVGSAPCV